MSRDLLLKFWDPSISRERLALEMSNLPCGFIPGVLTKEMQNQVKGVRKGSRDLLWKFWDPSLSRERLDLENLFQILAGRLTTRGTTDRVP